ncbi:MAG: hypothetical protein ACYCUM_08745 [Solirubrobacteraceae bacterium]
MATAASEAGITVFRRFEAVSKDGVHLLAGASEGEDLRLRGPIVPLLGERGEIQDRGVIDQALDFINRNISHSATLKDARREDRAAYPAEALREAVVNAVAHRDYTIAVTDIELAIFNDRIEIVSPGRVLRQRTRRSTSS